MRRANKLVLLAVVTMLLLLPLGACSAGPYVWAHDLPMAPSGSGDEYVLGPGDMVNIQIFAAGRREDNMSTRARVRPDGRIAIPVAGEVVAQGKRPAELGKELEGKLKSLLESPSVNIIVEEPQGISVTVLGEVARGGVFTMDPRSGVMQALATAGGLTEYADKDRIFVVRKAPAMRVRFTFDQLSHGDARALAFMLRAGDVVVVE